MTSTDYQILLGAKYRNQKVYAPTTATLSPMAARNRELEHTIHTWIDFLIGKGLPGISKTWVEVVPHKWHLSFDLIDAIRESARSLPEDYAQRVNPATLEYDRFIERITSGVCRIDRRVSYRLFLKTLASTLADEIALKRMSEGGALLDTAEVFEKIDANRQVLERVLSSRVRIIPKSEHIPYLLSLVNTMEYFLVTARRSSLLPLTMEALENYQEFQKQLEMLRSLIRSSPRIALCGDLIPHITSFQLGYFTINEDNDIQYEMDISAVPLGNNYLLLRTRHTGVVDTRNGPRLGIPLQAYIGDDGIRIVMRSAWPTPVLASPPPEQFLLVPSCGKVVLVDVLENDLYLSPLAISVQWQHPLQLVLGLSALSAQIIDRDYRLIRNEQSRRPGCLDRLLTAIAMRYMPCRSLTLEQFLTVLWSMSRAKLNPTVHAAPILLEGLNAAEQHKALSVAEYWEAERETPPDQLDYHIFKQRYETLNAITILSHQEPEESWCAQPLSSDWMSC